jgi:predicted ATP-grasp superfamily ATP-dependent carboligase
LPDEYRDVVYKPQFGAGSTATAHVLRAESGGILDFLLRDYSAPMIGQEYVTGQPASVAFLCGPTGDCPMIPAYQNLSDDDWFKYLGGRVPTSEEHADRAVRLARRAVECVRGLSGYVGVDLVLGSEPDGSADFAIEIYPRLTRSYVGLRALAEFNLAEAMVRVAEGRAGGPFAWKAGAVRFTPDGGVAGPE